MTLGTQAGAIVAHRISRQRSVGSDGPYQNGTAARQLELEGLEDWSLGHREPPGPAEAIPFARQCCALCQVRQVMIRSRGSAGTDLFHSLCFRCYHGQMQWKRRAKRRRAQAVVHAGTNELFDNLHQQSAQPPEPKYRALEHRRRQAQMVARREVEGNKVDPLRVSRIVRAAVLAGRAS